MESQKLINDTDEALKIVDKLILKLPSHSPFEVNRFIKEQTDWTESEKYKSYPIEHHVQSLLVDVLKYADYKKDRTHLYLNNTGRKVQKKGGRDKFEKESFFVKHPYLEKLSLVIAGGILTLSGNYFLQTKARQLQNLKESQQDSVLKVINESLPIFQKHIEDSSIHYNTKQDSLSNPPTLKQQE